MIVHIANGVMEERRAKAAGEMRLLAERRDLVEPQEQVLARLLARSGGLGSDKAGAGTMTNAVSSIILSLSLSPPLISFSPAAHTHRKPYLVNLIRSDHNNAVTHLDRLQQVLYKALIRYLQRILLFYNILQRSC